VPQDARARSLRCMHCDAALGQQQHSEPNGNRRSCRAIADPSVQCTCSSTSSRVWACERQTYRPPCYQYLSCLFLVVYSRVHLTSLMSQLPSSVCFPTLKSRLKSQNSPHDDASKSLARNGIPPRPTLRPLEGQYHVQQLATACQVRAGSPSR
jgi:hypothetical protein